MKILRHTRSCTSKNFHEVAAEISCQRAGVVIREKVYRAVILYCRSFSAFAECFDALNAGDNFFAFVVLGFLKVGIFS